MSDVHAEDSIARASPTPPPRSESRGGHERLIEALAARDPNAARAVMLDHVAATETAIRGILAGQGVSISVDG